SGSNKARACAAGDRSGATTGDEDGNGALGPLLVLRVRRVCRDRALPPLVAFGSADLAQRRVERLRPVLDHDRIRMRSEVVVPDRVLRRAAHRRHERVLAVVFHPHERGLAQLARLVAPSRDDDHRQTRVEQRVGLTALRLLVGLDLLAHPVPWTRLVLIFPRHGRTLATRARGPETGIPQLRTAAGAAAAGAGVATTGTLHHVAADVAQHHLAG